MKVALFYDRIRYEEKSLAKALSEAGVKLELQDAKRLELRPEEQLDFDISLIRCVSHFRGLYLAAFLNSVGMETVNRFEVLHVAGDKLLCSLALYRSGIPVPEFSVAFTPESALRCVESIGYPAVLKPVVGSWGRLVSLVGDDLSAKAVLEHRETLGGPLHRIYYVQRYVAKPRRDVRVIVVGDCVVAAAYRYAPEDDWRTNVARGGKMVALEPSEELCDVALRAAEAVGGGVLGVDVLEGPEGLLVNEVNPTVEFKGISAATGVDVAMHVAKYVLEVARC